MPPRNTSTLLLVALGGLALSALPLGAQGSTLRVPGLEKPVEIIVDQWGIPHIYAQTEPDLFFAQGYNAARDRLFQLEMWRRQATGTLSEILGPRVLKKDIGARLLRYRGDMDAELTHYHERGPAIFDAFVRGINAYIAETERDPALLPVEFRVLGIQPGRWTPEVVVSRLGGLFRNVSSEVHYAQLLQKMDAETLKSLSTFQPADPDLRAPGVDLSLITGEITELYNEARDPVTFVREDVVAAYRGPADAPRVADVAAEPEREPDWLELGYGSNNWVVSARLSATGRPLHANDPHRAISVPPLRYVVHLNGPGWNVIGSGEPTVPGVSMGHNEFGSFALTIHSIDMEDLYVYDTNPANRNEYRYQNGWEPMRVVRESIPVKGQAPQVVELKFTRHGPVLHEDRANGKAYALRAAWLEPGGAPYLGQMRYAQARNLQEFRRGVAYHLAPSHNVVWADVHGDIGWQVAGIAPVRRNWSGVLPVAGDGRHEWDGYKPIPELPSSFNPAEGFIATANEYNVPAGYPFVYGHEHSDPLRSQRIHELLRARTGPLSLADMHRIQQDFFSIPARTLLPLLRPLAPRDALARQAHLQLMQWNQVLDPGSVPAGIYIAWERRLARNVADLSIPAAARPLMNGVPTTRLLEWLTTPDARFGSDPVAGRNELLLRSLDEAVAELRGRFGPDLSRWRYGQPEYKHIVVRHPLGRLVSPELQSKLDVGPLPRGGTAYTVNPTGAGDNQTSGPSYRIITDVGNWDAAVGITTPGQSGDPDSPHYRDLFEAYVGGRHVPFLFSRPAIRAAAERTLTLLPDRTSSR